MDSRILVMTTLSFALVTACGGKKKSGEVKQPTAAAPAASANGPKSPQPGGTTGATDDVRTSDLDNDGRPEVTKYYKTIDDPERPGQKKTILVRQDIDLTWDGKVDIWRYFDDNGMAEKEEWDTDYDGKIDETRFFEGGVIVRSERDRNNDGRPDVMRYYKEGKLERKETDTNGDGQVDRWEYFQGRVLDRVGVDRDHDGSVDSWAKADGA